MNLNPFFITVIALQVIGIIIASIYHQNILILIILFQGALTGFVMAMEENVKK